MVVGWGAKYSIFLSLMGNQIYCKSIQFYFYFSLSRMYSFAVIYNCIERVCGRSFRICSFSCWLETEGRAWRLFPSIQSNQHWWWDPIWHHGGWRKRNWRRYQWGEERTEGGRDWRGWWRQKRRSNDIGSNIGVFNVSGRDSDDFSSGDSDGTSLPQQLIKFWNGGPESRRSDPCQYQKWFQRSPGTRDTLVHSFPLWQRFLVWMKLRSTLGGPGPFRTG